LNLARIPVRPHAFLNSCSEGISVNAIARLA
jgi:hypothetical protein